ncbi:MAG: hypothetical protein IJ191_01280 [Treponema sp.]|nr:hypothetical protein [Treponema sp.]
MKKISGSFLWTLIVVSAPVLLFSCIRSAAVQSVEQVNLFSLPYGAFDDEVYLFDVARVGQIRTTLAMRDGFFYIANGGAQKVFELNSYGDVLSLYYTKNDDDTLQMDDRFAHIKREIPFPVTFSNALAVDAHKTIYLAGELPRDRHEYDAANRLLNSHIVLRFTEGGTVIDYLGQQGIGGDPFPFIQAVTTTGNDELVVTCTTNDGAAVYWFSAGGMHMYTVLITRDTIPLPFDVAGDVFPAIETVFPDATKAVLYVKVDFYAPHVDRSANVQTGIDFVRTALYPLSIETGTYDIPVVIPPYEQEVTEDYSRFIFQLPYDYLGVTKSGWHFFMLATENGFTVEMVQPDSQAILRRQFTVSRDDLLYHQFALSDTGIISALFGTQRELAVVWWRTDTLIASLLKS